MGKRIEYKEGQPLGDYGCIYLHELPSRIKNGLKVSRRAKFMCSCGIEFDSTPEYVKIGDTKSCGCRKIKVSRKQLTTHALRDHPLYSRWHRMIRRCHDPRVWDYPYYGGRGVCVCEEWRNDFVSYFDCLITLDGYNESKLNSKGISLERKDNDMGYEPGNVKWASRHDQAVNKRKYNNNTSGYVGVSLSKRLGKYMAYISVNGYRTHIGYFLTPLTAAEARDWYIIKNGLWEYKLQVVRSG